jgi:transposase
MWETAARLEVDKQDAELMDQLIRCGSTPQQAVLRMRIVLGASEGVCNSQVAHELGTTRSTVIKWRERYRTHGLEGILEDAPRSGRRKTMTAEKEAEIVQATLSTKPADGTHWSTRIMAAAQGVSDTTVHRIWKCSSASAALC